MALRLEPSFDVSRMSANQTRAKRRGRGQGAGEMALPLISNLDVGRFPLKPV